MVIYYHELGPTVLRYCVTVHCHNKHAVTLYQVLFVFFGRGVNLFMECKENIGGGGRKREN